MSHSLEDEFWSRVSAGMVCEERATEWVKEFEHLGMDLHFVHPQQGSVLHWAFRHQWSSLAIYLMKQGVSPLIQAAYDEIPAHAWANTYESKGSQEGQIIRDAQNGLVLDASACVAMFSYETEQRWKDHFADDARFVEQYLLYVLPHFWLPQENTFTDDALEVLSCLVKWAPKEQVKEALPSLESPGNEKDREMDACIRAQEDRIRRQWMREELKANIKPVVGTPSLNPGAWDGPRF